MPGTSPGMTTKRGVPEDADTARPCPRPLAQCPQRLNRTAVALCRGPEPLAPPHPASLDPGSPLRSVRGDIRRIPPTYRPELPGGRRSGPPGWPRPRRGPAYIRARSGWPVPAALLACARTGGAMGKLFDRYAALSEGLICRVEDWRASFRVRWLVRRFRFGPQSGSHGRVSSPRSSNRTCGFPASGFRTRSCLRPRKAGRSHAKADKAMFCP